MQIESENLSKKTIKSSSDTRWNCRIKAIRSIIENLPIIIETLLEIDQTDAKSGSEAGSLLRCVQNFEFIFCLQVLKDILGLTNSLNLYLQSPMNNYATVKNMAKHTIESINSYRNDTKFNELWTISKEMCDQNNIDPPKIPRRSKIPIKLGGGDKQIVVQTVQDYFKIDIYLPFIDLLVNDISSSFSENDLDILQALCEVLIEESPSSGSITSVCKTYLLNESEIKGGLVILNRMFKNANLKNTLENKIYFFKENNLKIGFENIIVNA